MKTQLSGTFNVPASGIPAVSEPVNALTEQVNNLQRRYYRSLAPDCEVKTVPDNGIFALSAGRVQAFCFRHCWQSLHYVFIRQRSARKEVRNEQTIFSSRL